MAQIHELPSHLADLIAAGEVVERPASVAKELIENAIDAGATRITVEMENGGISYLRVADNGCGIAPEDAPIAFKRHATSKLRSEDDLAAIGTLGFRGEALAAIAAVSRIDLLTKQAGMLAGVHLHLVAGEIQQNEEAGCPDGTTIIIRDLFFNTPARMKFLKKDFTEAGYITAVVQQCAISHPEICFSLIRDGKPVFSTAGDGKLITPVYTIFGRVMSSTMVEVPVFERENLKVWGYITKPFSARPNRSQQHFFVNGRYVKSRLMQAALEQAYRNKIISGKYPSCALFLSLPLGAVDVNVHPAKTEVKFSNEKQVFDAVYIACKNIIETAENIPQFSMDAKPVKEDNITGNQQVISPAASPAEPPSEGTVSDASTVYTPSSQPSVQQPAPRRKTATPLYEMSYHAYTPGLPRSPGVECDDFEDGQPINKMSQISAFQNGQLAQATSVVYQMDEGEAEEPPKPLTEAELEANAEKAYEAAKASEKTGGDKPTGNVDFSKIVRVIGEAFHTYIVAEAETGIFLIDKHAAHERIIFNELMKTTDIVQQQLLSPVLVELSPAEAAVLTENTDLLAKSGFETAPFGPGTLAVRSAPAYLDSADIASTISEIADKLLTNRTPVPGMFDDVIHTVACKAAIKAGSHTTMQEMQALCERVLSDPEVSCCPHGRPVTVSLSKYEIDKMFKRVNQ